MIMKQKSDYPIYFGHRTDGDFEIDFQESEKIENESEQHFHDGFEVA